MAQLVEQRIRNAQVIGSSPITSSKKNPHELEVRGGSSFFAETWKRENVQELFKYNVKNNWKRHELTVDDLTISLILFTFHLERKGGKDSLKYASFQFVNHIFK